MFVICHVYFCFDLQISKFQFLLTSSNNKGGYFSGVIDLGWYQIGFIEVL